MSKRDNFIACLLHAILLDEAMKKNPRKSLKYRSFELLYKKIANPLMRFIIKKMNGDVEAAEEVFSRTVYAALRGWYTFNNKSSYFTWICKIALNKMSDYYRERVHEKSKLVAPTLYQLSEIPSQSLSHEEKMALDHLRDSIHNCLLLLPKEKRDLLYLKYWRDLTIEKMAEITGNTDRSIEGKLYRAKKELAIIVATKYPELYLKSKKF